MATLSLRLTPTLSSSKPSFLEQEKTLSLEVNRQQPVQAFAEKTKVSPWFLPQYAKDNPANWAPLCHMEADIEKELPIGIWINWEESSLWKDRLGHAASLRLKLMKF